MSSPNSAEVSATPSPAPSSVGNKAPMFGTLVPNRVFVGGLSASTTEQDLLELFSRYGAVKATKIICDRAGVSKGYGFVTFETDEEALRLTREEDSITLKDRKLNIAPAIKKQVSDTYSPRLLDSSMIGNTGGTVFFSSNGAYPQYSSTSVPVQPTFPQAPPAAPTTPSYHPSTTFMYPQPMFLPQQYQYHPTTVQPHWGAAAPQWRWLTPGSYAQPEYNSQCVYDPAGSGGGSHSTPPSPSPSTSCLSPETHGHKYRSSLPIPPPLHTPHCHASPATNASLSRNHSVLQIQPLSSLSAAKPTEVTKAPSSVSRDTNDKNIHSTKGSKLDGHTDTNSYVSFPLTPHQDSCEADDSSKVTKAPSSNNSVICSTFSSCNTTTTVTCSNTSCKTDKNLTTSAVSSSSSSSIVSTNSKSMNDTTAAASSSVAVGEKQTPSSPGSLMCSKTTPQNTPRTKKNLPFGSLTPPSLARSGSQSPQQEANAETTNTNGTSVGSSSGAVKVGPASSLSTYLSGNVAMSWYSHPHLSSWCPQHSTPSHMPPMNPPQASLSSFPIPCQATSQACMVTPTWGSTLCPPSLPVPLPSSSATSTLPTCSTPNHLTHNSNICSYFTAPQPLHTPQGIRTGNALDPAPKVKGDLLNKPVSRPNTAGQVLQSVVDGLCAHQSQAGTPISSHRSWNGPSLASTTSAPQGTMVTSSGAVPSTPYQTSMMGRACGYPVMPYCSYMMVPYYQYSPVMPPFHTMMPPPSSQAMPLAPGSSSPVGGPVPVLQTFLTPKISLANSGSQQQGSVCGKLAQPTYSNIMDQSPKVEASASPKFALPKTGLGPLRFHCLTQLADDQYALTPMTPPPTPFQDQEFSDLKHVQL